MNRLIKTAALLAAVSLLSACNTVPTHKVHQRLIDRPTSVPKKVLLLPIDVVVKELDASGNVEEDGNWTAQAISKIGDSLPSHLESDKSLQIILAPKLTAKEQSLVDEHMALFDRVSGNIIWAGHPINGNAWGEHVKRTQYTIGDGLSFLADKTGADTGLFVVGEDYISSDGRKAAFVVAAMFGVGIQMGHSYVYAGMVDLRTGDILWSNHSVALGSGSLKDKKHVDSMVQQVFSKYPGIEEYDKWLNGKQ